MLWPPLKAFSCSLPECISHPAQLSEDMRFSLWSVPLLPAVTLAFLNLFAEQSNVSKSLCIVSYIITGVWIWGYLSEEEMSRAHWMPFLPVGRSSETNHSAAFTAALCRMRAWGGVAEQKMITANQVSVVLLLCAMGIQWKKWLRWKKIESLLNVSLDTSSKWEHNKIVFLEKILVKLSFVFCLKRGGGEW